MPGALLTRQPNGEEGGRPSRRLVRLACGGVALYHYLE